MVKQVIQNILFLIVGLIIGYCVGCNKQNVNVEKIVETKIKIDTFVKEIKVDVTKIKHDVVYISLMDTLLQQVPLTDTVYVPDFSHDSIPINVYTGTEETNEFKLEYEVKTLGQMLSFKPTVTTFQKTVTEIKKVQPKWMISGAISNNLNYKLGFGYRGWTVEGVLGKNNRELYIGKQFNF